MKGHARIKQPQGTVAEVACWACGTGLGELAWGLARRGERVTHMRWHRPPGWQEVTEAVNRRDAQGRKVPVWQLGARARLREPQAAPNRSGRATLGTTRLSLDIEPPIDLLCPRCGRRQRLDPRIVGMAVLQ